MLSSGTESTTNSATGSPPSRSCVRTAPALPRRTGRSPPALPPTADAARTSPVCHGDLHGDNIVLAGPSAVRHLVDFTDAAAGPRESDVAQTLVMSRRPPRPSGPAQSPTPTPSPSTTTCWPPGPSSHTTRSWAHSSPGEDRALWARRPGRPQPTDPAPLRPHAPASP
ncbi:aminoglycoside phosphotransferase family protein [Streptomyces narbonensis]